MTIDHPVAYWVGLWSAGHRYRALEDVETAIPARHAGAGRCAPSPGCLLDRQPRQDSPDIRTSLITAVPASVTALATDPGSSRGPDSVHYGEASAR